MANTEAIVYLLRKTSLTRAEIGKLTPSQFAEILKELYYQESVEEYRNQFNVAEVLAAVYNTIPRRQGSKVYKASDFLTGGPPERNPQPENTLDKMAEEKGIKLPTR